MRNRSTAKLPEKVNELEQAWRQQKDSFTELARLTRSQ